MTKLRRIWVVSVNLICIAFLLLSFAHSIEIASYAGANWTSGFMNHQLGPAICVIVLICGIVFELLNAKFAGVVNVIFFAVLGAGALIQAALSRSESHHPSESALIVALIGVPFSVIAIIDAALYLMTSEVHSPS